MVHDFPTKTPICHIVPISRIDPGGDPSLHCHRVDAEVFASEYQTNAAQGTHRIACIARAPQKINPKKLLPERRCPKDCATLAKGPKEIPTS